MGASSFDLAYCTRRVAEIVQTIMKLAIGIVLSLVVSLVASNPYRKFEREDDLEDFNDWLDYYADDQYEDDEGDYESNRGVEEDAQDLASQDEYDYDDSEETREDNNPVNGGCQDEDEDLCMYWSDYCDDSYVLESCPKTCGACKA